MLSLFPQILFLAPFTSFLLRIAIAITLAYCAWKHSSMSRLWYRLLALVEVLAGVLIAVGAWTQAAAVIGFCIVLIWFAFPSTRSIALSSVFLIMIMTICLIISGAGLLAFDLPL